MKVEGGTMKHAFAVALLTAFTAGCGNSSPTGPSGMTPASMAMDLPSGSMMSSGCSARATGTARVSGTTMTGSYSGLNSCTGAFTNGQMTMTRQIGRAHV